MQNIKWSNRIQNEWAFVLIGQGRLLSAEETFEVKYEGFVGGDNESQLKSKATASTSATKTSDVGTYPIYVSGGSADNYKLSYVSGMLTINKIEQTISWQQDLTALNVGDQVELKAVASSRRRSRCRGIKGGIEKWR